MVGASMDRIPHRTFRCARRWSTALVLLMLGLRAAVPAGFMLAPVDGRLAVVLCDTDARSALARSGHGHDHGTGHHHQHLDPTCPFAQSAGPAPLPEFPVLGPQPLAGGIVLPEATGRTDPNYGPVRQHSSRGPPHLA